MAGIHRAQEEEEKVCGVGMELSWAAALGSSRPQQRSWSRGERQKTEGRGERVGRDEEGSPLQGAGWASGL